MKRYSILLFSFFLASFCHAQSFYGCMGAGVVPHDSKFYFDGHLTFGKEIGKHGFAEYNQVSALTHLSTVPSYFQLRGGYSFKIARTEDLRVFVGSGVRPAYYNEVGKVKGCITYGFYLFQKIDDEVYMRYEVAFNNVQFMPSIGIGSKF